MPSVLESLQSTLDSHKDSNSRSANSSHHLQRVEVNQRALIDKILARYATAGAVYRELLQNSNDANATVSEIYFYTSTDNNKVTQVVYRNNGMPFRTQDWDRLRKIAEGNPDETKIGAFGVGFYSVFSICENPVVISGQSSLQFVWRGDALYTQQAAAPTHPLAWTSFVLQSRDVYPLPNLQEFGSFLCASLTFTANLKHVRVLVNDKPLLELTKTMVQPPRPVSLPKNGNANNWFWTASSAAAPATTTTRGLFSLIRRTGRLQEETAIFESLQRLTVTLYNDDNNNKPRVCSKLARFVSVTAHTKIPSDMVARMVRVTKKQPPKKVQVHLLLNSHDDDNDNDSHDDSSSSLAYSICQSFLPSTANNASGRIFIGFRTSQTTGLAAHIAAPFLPTVEREAMDLQDAVLRIYNTELLECAGLALRLTLEQVFGQLDQAWQESKAEREAWEVAYKNKKKQPAAAAIAEQGDNVDNDEEGKEDKESSGSVVRFARFMMGGVKKSIVKVVSSVEKHLLEDDAWLRPPDPRPLSAVERQAIVLMQSFCPKPSTPDMAVGTALAQGFSRCMPSSPPVLTRSGVVRGDQARIPHLGMEAFLQDHVVRQVVFDNAQEYHQVIAAVPKLTVDHLLVSLQQQAILDEDDMVKLVQWWTKFAKVERAAAHRLASRLKEAIRFVPSQPMGACKVVDGKSLVQLDDLRFYVAKDSLLASAKLPLPDVVLPTYLQEKLGHGTLADPSLRTWFTDLPMEIWAEFVSHHGSMNNAKPEDELVRVKILSILSKEFERRTLSERVVFGGFCQSLLGEKRCLPFDSTEPTQFAAERPSELYLYSAELGAFEGVGSFFKVSGSLKDAGVTEGFLLTLGVRKSVSVDFLFTNLEKLKWSDNPKSLVEYLRKATLTQADLQKLAATQYLPADGDQSRLFAPRELYLPNQDLGILPFVRMLRWPAEAELSERSENGRFLTRLGMKSLPPLVEVLTYLSQESLDRAARVSCLDFLSERLGPRGSYLSEYDSMYSSTKNKYRFIPCVVKTPLEAGDNDDKMELHSPVTCFSETECAIMGFPVIDPSLGTGKLYGSLFQCAPEPNPNLVINMLHHMVARATTIMQDAIKTQKDNTKVLNRIDKTFAEVFVYLAQRSTEMSRSLLDSLKKETFIPCRKKNTIVWYRPDQVFFRRPEGGGDRLTEELFEVIEFNAFLAAVGVKQEATTEDLFRRMLASPEDVLSTLGSEKKYRSLLRRIAANRPFSRVTAEIRDSPFLLAYIVKPTDEGKDEHKYELAKAADIYIIDNSFFSRMFTVKRAPAETDLEDFYHLLGSNYISKKVERRFEVVGKPVGGSDLTTALEERLHERGPLLVSPSVTSRPLVKDAGAILQNLQILQAANLLAVYSLDGMSRRTQTTCCPKRLPANKRALIVVEDFDWFDVGYAIGDMILSRCQLEDSFFISSLLEAPLDQLRARGFPVDRLLKPEQPVVVEKDEPVAEPKKVGDRQGPVPNQPGAVGVTPASTSPTPATAAPVSPETAKPPLDTDLIQALRQMYPDADADFLRSALGPGASPEDASQLAEAMAAGNYPRNGDSSDASTVATASSLGDESRASDATSKKKRGRFGRRLGKAFGGLRGSNFGGATPPATSPVASTSATSGPSASGVMGPSTTHETKAPVSPASDAQSHANLESMLEQTARASAQVNGHGVNSAGTKLTSIPSELERGATCEMIPGHSLKPFAGPRGNGRTLNGIRVFSSREYPSSEIFLSENQNALDAFAIVLERLGGVYGLELSSVAIFHDPAGGTIAFNLNRALHFNLRFFYALHYLPRKQLSPECFSYWFITFAHELAHHLVHSHGKEHGFYTESYASKYLPKLLEIIKEG